MEQNREKKNIPVGIVYGKTTPYLVEAIALKDSPSIGIGRLVKIQYLDENKKQEFLLGRVISVWTKNRLLLDENMMPKLRTKDLEASSMTIEHLGLASEIAGMMGFSVLIIGRKIGNAFVRPRIPLNPGTIIYMADDEFVSSFFIKDRTIIIGNLRDNHNVPAYIDYEKLVTHHFSVLAMTGAGKSYTVGVILEELYLIDNLKLPIILIDPHSEYSSTLIPNEDSREAREISKSVLTFVPGEFNYLLEKKFEDVHGRKRVTISVKFHPAELETWQIKTLLSQYYGISEAQSASLDRGWDEIHMEALDGNPPTSIEELIEKSIERIEHKGTRRALENKMRALLKRPYFTFGKGTDVSEFVKKGQISILDLGGIEAFDQQALVGLILRKLFDLRKTSYESKIKPFLTIIEEAHNFIPPGTSPSASKQIIARVASEGRKFGMGLCIVSQRPSKVDADILSQCNTHFILRMMNPKDQNYVQNIAEHMTKEDFEAIKGLATGEAMVTGLSVPFTLLVNIKKRRMKHGGVTPSIKEELEK
ncbi:MAG: ATP-binding protein [Candidatus Heimdallarchaeum aukensis]|uniref:ATP-binding protein n=1 Tax=Candidatus Heimdallarchaeum aukensis TaxID=2876573 RepID=A0A9Y1BKB0_9ARCH|nr:MAG: ATP-binding protein [Candidatus Heimdallarchaeum aukensis]